MAVNAREEILGRLRKAFRTEPPPRPNAPPMEELSWDREKMMEKFTENVTLQTGVVHRVADDAQAAAKLAEIARAEGLKKVMASTDEVVVRLRLARWGKKNGVEVLVATDYADREAYRRAVFNEVQAGITGADFALAESGTLVLAHCRDQPRLLSLAPIIHIAVVSVERLFPTYESAIEAVFAGNGKAPSLLTFITGPSMTADIQAVPFRGMHGPKRLVVIVVGRD